MIIIWTHYFISTYRFNEMRKNQHQLLPIITIFTNIFQKSGKLSINDLISYLLYLHIRKKYTYCFQYTPYRFPLQKQFKKNHSNFSKQLSFRYNIARKPKIHKKKLKKVKNIDIDEILIRLSGQPPHHVWLFRHEFTDWQWETGDVVRRHT